MKTIIAQVAILSALAVTACSGPQPLPATSTPQASTPEVLADTLTPTMTFTPQIISAVDTPTPDVTETAIRAFAATAEAVATDVSALGGGWAQVEGTLSALGLMPPTNALMPATTTPLPFPVSTQQVQVSWGVATEYTFADPNDLQAARQAYEQFLEFISFQDGPLPDGLEATLASHMMRDGSRTGPTSCLFDDVLRGLASKAAQGRYIRLKPANGLAWDDDRVFLDVGASGIRAALGWEMADVLVELVDAQTGAVIKNKVMTMAGTAHLTYLADARQWQLEDDSGGFYCEWIGFLR